MQATIYNIQGKDAGTVQLPERVFAQAWNPDLVHEVILSMQSNARTSGAHTKTRAEVRGGGKKPWRQKGTGRARHGSRRSPIWTGGGVTFGPRSEKKYTKKINRNTRAKALSIVLSRKLEDDQIIFLDSFALSAPKATDAKNILASLSKISGKEHLSTKRTNTALIVVDSRDENVEKSFRNFGNILVKSVKDINPVLLLTYKYVIVANPDDSVALLSARVATKAEKSEKEVSAPAKEAKVVVRKKTTVKKAPVQTAKKVTKKVATKKVSPKKKA